jgi:antitoxin MazE
VRAQVSKWGNSLAIRLPRAAIKSLHVQEGEQVQLTIRGGRVEISAARRCYRLEDLVSQITPDNQPEPIEFPPVGKELL